MKQKTAKSPTPEIKDVPTAERSGPFVIYHVSFIVHANEVSDSGGYGSFQYCTTAPRSIEEAAALVDECKAEARVTARTVPGNENDDRPITIIAISRVDA